MLGRGAVLPKEPHSTAGRQQRPRWCGTQAVSVIWAAVGSNGPYLFVWADGAMHARHQTYLHVLTCRASRLPATMRKRGR